MNATARDPAVRWLMLACLACVGLAVALPCVTLIRESLRVGSDWSVGNYRKVIEDARTLRLLGTTVALSAVVTVVSGSLGFLFAWIAARSNAPLRRWMPVAVLLPYMIPPTLGAIAWILLLSPSNGLVNQLLRPLFGQAVFNIYSFAGMVFVESAYTFPLSFAFFYATLVTMNPSLEEASAVSGAGAFRTFRSVTLPAMVPTILSVGTVIFIVALESFDVAWFLGYPAKIYTLSIQVFLLTRYDYPSDIGAASVFGVVALVAALLLVAAYRHVTRDQGRFVAISGKAYRPGTIDLGRMRWPCCIAFWVLIAVIGVAPLLLLLGIATDAFAWPFRISGGASLRHFAWIFGDGQTRTALVNTAIVALLGPLLVVAVATLVAYLLVRTDLKGRSLLDYLAFLPFGFPSTVLAVGVMTALITTPLYNTLWILLLAYTLKFLPYGLRNLSNSMLQLHPELEEASAISGAALFTTLRRVVLPLVAPGIFAAWSLLFIVFGRQFSLPVMLSASGTEVLTIMMFQEFDGGQIGHTAAFGILLIGASLPFLAAVRLMAQGPTSTQ